MRFRAYFVFLQFFLSVASLPAVADVPTFRGINLAGAEMGSKVIPGQNGKNYLWPTAADIALYAQAGFNTVRVPFLWARMQPQLHAPFSATELGLLDGVVEAAKSNHVTIILDLHNYGSYGGEVIGSANVPLSAFEDFWSRVANRYKGMPHVAFGLMNEPNKQKAEEWSRIAQAGVTAIRKTGAKQMILVPGTRWSGAHSWLSKEGRLSNAEALAGIQDPEKNSAFELHQYFDGNSSGTSPTCVNENIGVQRLQKVTNWLKTTGHKGFLGEFGASNNPVCLIALKNTLEYLEKNTDIWHGWTYWAASPWFRGYMFNIYPPDPTLFPQMRIIKLHLPN